MIPELFLSWVNTLPLALGIVVIAWAAARFWPGTGAATRHAIWWAALAALVALPCVPMIRASLVRLAEAEAAPVAIEHVSSVSAPVDSVELPAPARPASNRIEIVPGAWLQALTALWLLFAAGQAARILVSYRALRALKQAAQPAPREWRNEAAEWALTAGLHREFRLLVSADIESPVAVGFFHPAVILPSGLLSSLEPEDLQHILLHELAHLARRDDWTNLLLRFLGGLLALNPLAHWVIERIDSEREMACDDWVVAVTGQPRPYAVSLARLVELNAASASLFLATGMADRGAELGDRIERLLRSAIPGSGRTSIVRLSASALMLALLVAAGGFLPQFAAWAEQTAPAAAATPSQPAPAAKPAAATKAAKVKPQASSPAQPSQAAQSPQPAQSAQPSQKAEPESFLATLKQSGYNDLSVDEIIELKIQGVDGRYMRGMNDAGLGRLSTRQLVEMKIHGVSPEFVRGLRDEGLAVTDPREVIEARIHGIDPGTVREAKKFSSSLTLRQMIRLKQSGVI